MRSIPFSPLGTDGCNSSVPLGFCRPPPEAPNWIHYCFFQIHPTASSPLWRYPWSSSSCSFPFLSVLFPCCSGLVPSSEILPLISCPNCGADIILVVAGRGTRTPAARRLSVLQVPLVKTRSVLLASFFPPHISPSDFSAYRPDFNASFSGRMAMRECRRISPGGHRGSYKLRALAFRCARLARPKGSVALIHGERMPTGIFLARACLSGRWQRNQAQVPVPPAWFA